jgi:hypothetical protein
MTPQDPLRGLAPTCCGSAAAPTTAWVRRGGLSTCSWRWSTIPLPDTEPPAPLPPALRAVLTQLRKVWSSSPLPRVGVTQLAAMSGVSRGYG